jgi:photosystem II stability/assembly factor-like uncharacterized protein
MKRVILLIVLGIMLIPTGCKKDDKEEPKPNPEPQSGEVVVADVTKIMDASTRQAIASIDTVNYTFVFNNETELVKNLKVGDILVDSCSEKAPYGYLRKITSIEGTKSGKTVKTQQAKLTEAVLQGSIDFTADELPLLRNRIRKMKLAPGVTLKQMKNTDFTVFYFDYDMNLGSDDAKINIKGNSSLDMGLFFKFDWTYQILPYPDVIVDLFKAGVEMNQSSSINITSDAGATLTENISLATFYFDPWTFSVGPVPVVFFPKVELVMDVDGNVSAVFSTGASEEYHGELGVQYTSESGFGPLMGSDFSYDYYAPSLELSSNITTKVGPKVSLMLYNVVGPYIYLSGYTTLDASYYSSTGNWDMDFVVGAMATTGIEVDIFSFEHDWHTDFNLFEQSLIHLENEPMETGIFFKFPQEGGWYPLGSDLKLQAKVTGQIPDEVVFFADGVQIGTDNSEPYEYVWNTTSASHGEHILIVNDVVNGEVIDADTVTISLLNSKWEIVDFSNNGLNNETVSSDVYFEDEETGYIIGGNAYGFGGYMLKTTDGGKTWDNIGPDGFTIAMMEMLHLNQGDFVIRMYEGSLFSSDIWDKEFGYPDDDGNWIVTFSDYTLYNLALSFDGYIYGVAKHYSNNDKYLLCKANTADHHFGGVIDIPYSGALPKVYFFRNKGIVYNLVNPGNPLRQYYMISENDGASWETRVLNVSGVTPEDKLYGAFFFSETHGWIVGHDSNGHAIVLITKDGGDNWEKVDVEEPYSFGSVSFINDNEGYATVNSENMYGYENHKLYHTQDGGYTWEAMDFSNSAFRLKKVRFLNYKRGFAVGHGATGYRFTVE